MSVPGFIEKRRRAIEPNEIVYLIIGPETVCARNIAQKSALRQGTAGFFHERFFLGEEGCCLAEIEKFSRPRVIARRGQNDSVIRSDLRLTQLFGREGFHDFRRLLCFALGMERKSVGGSVGRICRLLFVKLARDFLRAFRVQIQQQGNLRVIILHVAVVWLQLQAVEQNAVNIFRVRVLGEIAI